MAVEMEGEVAECLTKFTSLVPSAFHRSTVSTKNAVSSSLNGESRVSDQGEKRGAVDTPVGE